MKQAKDKKPESRQAGGSLSMLPLFFVLFVVSEGYSQFSLTGGNIVASITTGIPGGQPIAVTNTATSVRYRLETVVTKITVRTSCPGQKFNLAVVATTVGSGTAAPQVTLTNGMLDTDLIVSIPVRPPNNFQTATLQYTASSTFAQGDSAELGNDVHTVTYTLVAQ